MSDLISRSELYDELGNKLTWLMAYGDDVYLDVGSDIKDVIDNMPTAYDIDKVVEELDKSSDYYECEEQGREHVQMVDLTEAIEIVKQGGVSENRCEKKIDGVNGGQIPVFEKILEKLTDAGGCDADCEYDKGWDSAIGEAISIVQKVAEEYKGGWIPCSERLPDEVNKCYLVTLRHPICGEFEYATDISYLSTLPNGEKSWEIEEARSYLKVIAWMPLPDPYKESED